MPAALFIPEEHNCCYRYSYSGALQTSAASVSANNTAQYTHTHSCMPLTLSWLLQDTVHLHGFCSAISQSGAVDPGGNTSHIELPANEPVAHKTDLSVEHVPAQRLQIIMLIIT